VEHISAARHLVAIPVAVMAKLAVMGDAVPPVKLAVADNAAQRGRAAATVNVPL